MIFNHFITRRKFLAYLGAISFSSGSSKLFGRSQTATKEQSFSDIYTAEELKAFNSRFDAKGLPTTILGKTGVIIPRMGLGLGSRFCALALKDEQLAIEMLIYALDRGFYYWDTAPLYFATDKKTGRTVYSEAVLGHVVKYRRNEIFLNSKMCTRNPDEFMFSLENTLKLLNTDRLDMMMIHAVESMEDIENIRKTKLIERMEKLREEGVFKIFGFSAHGEANAIRTMVETNRFDTMLTAVDPYRHSVSGMREDAVSLASRRNMGVMLMKAIRGYEDRPNPNPSDTIRRALTFQGATGAMIGMDSIEIVNKNIALLKEVFPS